jgi:cytochrome P450
MLYELSRREAVQQDLRNELNSIETPFKDASAHKGIPASEDLERLPLLGAIIKESLRLRNTCPNLDPRVCPAHGRARLGRITNLRVGTRVGTYGWWLNRNAHVYPDPESWDPHRWLQGGPEYTATMSKWLFAFGSGSRGCIGQPIAMEYKMLFSEVSSKR